MHVTTIHVKKVMSSKESMHKYIGWFGGKMEEENNVIIFIISKE